MTYGGVFWDIFCPSMFTFSLSISNASGQSTIDQNLVYNLSQKLYSPVYETVIMSSTRIPTSTSVTESAVIPAQLADVWHLIKLQDFHVFWSKLDKSQHVKGASPETDVVKWTFKDGTVQEVKQEEHSVRDLAASKYHKLANGLYSQDN